MAAQKITVWGDNEVVNRDDLDDPRLYEEALRLKQEAPDAANQKRMLKIKFISKAALTSEIVYEKPPVGHHDLADWNLAVKEPEGEAVAVLPSAAHAGEAKAKRAVKFF